MKKREPKLSKIEPGNIQQIKRTYLQNYLKD